VVIVQADIFEATGSVTICGLTTDPSDVPLIRPEITPTSGNGLKLPSRILVDKITTLPRANLGERIGHLEKDDMGRLNRAMLVFLGLAGQVRA